MNSNRGSEWRKWDFHVHTPYSILNNNYGFDPFYLEAQKEKEPDSKELEVAFDGYVKELFTRAVDAGVAAIGITDYFMVDGYKRIRKDYLDKPGKMKELFPDQDLYEKIRQIFVFPNIELRVDTFVGEGANSVNYHVIFSDEVPIQDIEENFLGALYFKMNGDDQKSLTRHNIEALGKELIENNGAAGTPLVAGLNHVTVSYADIKSVLVKSKSFTGKYIITVPVDEDLSKVKWSGRDYSTRHNIYVQCNCFLTSNKRTIDWALGKNDEDGRKKEFGALKPCIWGSDAHEYERMFNPANDRFCWIKADPTFEGLQQILYEPAERVRIQDKCPSTRDPHQIISSIQFEDENFQTTPVCFNDYLTCIIGGKSTGKSLLLEQLARTIDLDLVDEQNKLMSSKRRPFSVKKAVVTWKDGTTDSRKIVYIPQTYLNRSIDNPEEKTAINRIIEDVLMQQPQISIGFSTLDATRKTICGKLKSDIVEYCTAVRRRVDLIEKIKEAGAPEVFQQTIKELEDEREALANRIDIQQDEIDEFGELEVRMAELLSTLQSLLGENENIVTMESPSVVFPEYFESRYDKTISHDFEEDFPFTHGELDGILVSLNNTVHAAWDAYKTDLIKLVQTKKDELDREKNECTTRYERLKEKVTQNAQLATLTAKIKAEREELAKSSELVLQKTQIDEKLAVLRENIISARTKLHDAYQEFCRIINDTSVGDETNLKFSAYPVWKLKDFQGGLSNILDNRNYTSFRNFHNFDLTDLSPEEYTDKFLEALWTAITDKNDLGSLAIKVGNTLESALTFIFKDWYNIYYEVKSGNDTIEEMSPGKKALVLLELLINLEDSKCPILIDQPEDDLDNRSIYNDLVQFIRAKKKERQIIIVTHNANVLLGADAEEVIIANQDGQNTPNMSKRFEYRSGAIENNQIPRGEKGSILPGILNATGLQTQICDILEGGRIAFELRQNKYRVITQDM